MPNDSSPPPLQTDCGITLFAWALAQTILGCEEYLGESFPKFFLEGLDEKTQAVLKLEIPPLLEIKPDDREFVLELVAKTNQALELARKENP